IAEGITHGHGSALLPAGLDEARDQAVVAEFAQRYAAHLELAIVGTRTTGHLATIADAGPGRVARQRGELELRTETLLDRLVLVHDDRLERRAPGRVAIDEL